MFIKISHNFKIIFRCGFFQIILINLCLGVFLGHILWIEPCPHKPIEKCCNQHNLSFWLQNFLKCMRVALFTFIGHRMCKSAQHWHHLYYSIHMCHLLLTPLDATTNACTIEKNVFKIYQR